MYVSALDFIYVVFIFGCYWSVLELSLSAVDATNSYLLPYLFLIGKHLLVFPTAKAKKAPNSVGPLLLDLEKNSMSSLTDSAAAADKITDLLIGHSLPLADIRLKPCKKKRINVQFVWNFRLTLKLLVSNVKLHLILEKTISSWQWNTQRLPFRT